MTPCEYPGCDGTAYKTMLCNAHYIRRRLGKPMEPPVRRRGDDPRRFWEKVDQSGECWEWKAFCDPAGYGRFEIGRIPRLAHRVSYERTVGPIPAGMEVDHLCHNPACVRPEHLRLATSSLNGQNQSGARRDSRSGIRGVRQKESGRWSAEATVNGTKTYLGLFDTKEEADAAVRGWRRTNMPFSVMDQEV